MKLLTLFMIGLLLLSCKKERTIHISAKNAVTGQPYPGLTYYVVQEMTAGDGEKTKTVATGTLDANGEVHLTKKLPKAYSYAIRVEQPVNACYNKQITFYFGTEETFNCNFEFAECATLQRKVKNINCIDSNDKIEIYIDNTVHSLLSAPWVLNGCADYTTVPTQVPIGTYTLHWIVTKNNVSTDYYDSFSLTENEFKIHEINY